MSMMMTTVLIFIYDTYHLGAKNHVMISKEYTRVAEHRTQLGQQKNISVLIALMQMPLINAQADQPRGATGQ